MLDSLTGGLISDAVVIALLGLIVKIWPRGLSALATWLYSHVDPGHLPYDSDMNRHWRQTSELRRQTEQVQDQLREIRKDTIKNTLVNLMEQPGDQSSKVRYELSKLESLDSHCWVMQEAEDYLAQHHREGRS